MKLWLILAAFSILFFSQSCDTLLQNIADDEQIIDNKEVNKNKENNKKGSDMPARKNFTDKDLSYRGQSIALTRHGRCRMGCRNIDAYEIQEVINQGRINARKSNPNSKPCPTIAFEGKTSDGQTTRVVLGTCKNDYKIVTVIDLDTDWKCDCK